MAYVPTNWADGVTPVDEAHLDHLEAGVVTADANASAAVAALPAKEDKSAKGAVNGYAPLDASQKVPPANLPPVGADLSFDGDWVAGTYQDGDVVVKDGVSFLCVGGPTAVAPDPTLWGALGAAPPVPAVVNGKWLKGVGGAMVWSDVVAKADLSVGVANVDAAAPTSDVFSYQVSPGGGSLRSVGQGTQQGQRLIIRCWDGASAFTVLHNSGTAPAGTSLNLRGAANLVLGPTDSIEFFWDGAWREVNRNVAAQAAMVKLGEVLVTSAVPTIAFAIPSAPAAARHLQIIGKVKPTVAGQQCRMQIGPTSPDTGANYRYTEITVAGGTPGAANNTGLTYWDLAYGSAQIVGAFDLTLYDYADTDFPTAMSGICRQSKQDTTIGEGALKIIEGIYTPTQAIGYLHFFFSSSSLFDVGSRISVYGLT